MAIRQNVCLSDLGKTQLELPILSDRVTISQLVTLVESIAGMILEQSYKIEAPGGVETSNSDDTLLSEEIERNYRWIEFDYRAETVSRNGSSCVPAADSPTACWA